MQGLLHVGSVEVGLLHCTQGVAVSWVGRKVGFERCIASTEIVLQVVRGQISLDVCVSHELQIILIGNFVFALGVLQLLVDDSHEFGGCIELVGASFCGGVCLALQVVFVHHVEGDEAVVVLVVDFVLLLQGRLQTAVGAPHDRIAQHCALEDRLERGVQQTLGEPRDIGSAL